MMLRGLSEACIVFLQLRTSYPQHPNCTLSSESLPLYEMEQADSS